MLRPIMLGLISLCCLAGDLPALNQSELFTHMAKDCEVVDLKTWQHPVRQLFDKRKIALERVSLCNARKYPVFYVRLPYDPQGQTRDYFDSLYMAMKKANGGWPFAFVDASQNTIVTVSYPASGPAYIVDYQMYRD